MKALLVDDLLAGSVEFGEHVTACDEGIAVRQPLNAERGVDRLLPNDFAAGRFPLGNPLTIVVDDEDAIAAHHLSVLRAEEIVICQRTLPALSSSNTRPKGLPGVWFSTTRR